MIGVSLDARYGMNDRTGKEIIALRLGGIVNLNMVISLALTYFKMWYHSVKAIADINIRLKNKASV